MHKIKVFFYLKLLLFYCFFLEKKLFKKALGIILVLLKNSIINIFLLIFLILIAVFLKLKFIAFLLKTAFYKKSIVIYFLNK